MDRRQILHEIEWLKNKLKEVKRPKHRRDIERQIKERELNLDHGVDRTSPLNPLRPCRDVCGVNQKSNSMNRHEIKIEYDRLKEKKRILQSEIEIVDEKMTHFYREWCLITDGQGRYEEKEEKIRIGRKKVVKLIGRRHWKESYTDVDTGHRITVDRSQIIKVNGDWII